MSNSEGTGYTPHASSRDALVDHHQHLFNPDWVEPARATTATDLVELMDAEGIGRAVVLSIAYQFGNPNRPAIENEYHAVKRENDWTSEQVSQFRRRLTGFCAINPLKDYALEEIDRCADDPNLNRGLKLHFGNSDVQMDRSDHVQRLQKVFAAANHHGMAVLVHLRSSVSKGRTYGAQSARSFIDEVLPSAPNVPIQIAHLAGAGGYDDESVDEALTAFLDAIARGSTQMSRVLFDISGVAGMGKWMERSELITARVRQLGVDRVLYGSDDRPGPWLAAFRQLPLSESEFRAIESNVAPYLLE